MMPVLLENYVGTVSLYVALAVAIFILCGGTCVCGHCCALANALLRFVLPFHHTLQRILIALPQAIEQLPAVDDQVVNHHILDIRPEYGIDIKKIISDIIDTLNQVSLDYPPPEKPMKYRRLPRKLDVRGWRCKLNVRWKRKMKFIRAVLWCVNHKDVTINGFQNEIEAEEDTENNSYSNSRESHINLKENCSEEFLLAPHRDEDADLNETTLLQGQPRKLTMFKAKPNGKLTFHWE